MKHCNIHLWLDYQNSFLIHQILRENVWKAYTSSKREAMPRSVLRNSPGTLDDSDVCAV